MDDFLSLKTENSMGLVLTRKKGEKINIGDDIVLTVQSINGKFVHLVLQAPESVPGDRVLTRRVGQKFTIGDEITVTIGKRSGPGIKLDVQAPGTVAVNRGEIHESKLAARKLAQSNQEGSSPK